MRNTLVALVGFGVLFVAGSFVSSAQEKPSGKLEIKMERLKEYYSKSSNRVDSMEFQLRFFEEFPSNFEEFNQIYGYIGDDLMPMYDDAYNHIELFNRISGVSRTTYYRKMIGIAIGGHWEADAVNYFLMSMRDNVMENPELTFDLLKDRPDEEILEFWFFYFDGPVTMKSIPKELERDPMNNHYEIIKAAYQKALKKNKD